MKEDVMKKLLVLALVLSMATLASAALKFDVLNTETSQYVDADTLGGISLSPSDHIMIGIEGNGEDSGPVPYIMVIGPGSINGGTILYAPGSTLAAYLDAEAKLAEWEMTMEDAQALFAADPPDGWGIPGVTDFSQAVIVSDSGTPPATIGLLVNGIAFHCEAPGDVVIRAIYWDDQGNIQNYDVLTITQVPEPMTMALLGLGGLFLRRRK